MMTTLLCQIAKASNQATCLLPMLPVRLRHAADHLAEHEHPVHLVFLDRVPRRIALVIGDNQQLVLHLLQALDVSGVVVQERVYPVAVETLYADVDEEQITRLNRARHAVAPDVDDPDVLGLSSIEHVARFRWIILNRTENLDELLVHNARSRADHKVQNINPECIGIMAFNLGSAR